MINCAADRVSHQIDALFGAWGMPEKPRHAAVEVMVETDRRGIDSHGLAMVPIYAKHRDDGRLDVTATAACVRESAIIAVFDGRGGLGHYPSLLATDFVIKAARTHGIAAAAVRGSHHFGAAGIYADRMVSAGLIGVVTSSGITPQVVPTFAAAPLFGTNPLAFAAPTRRNKPFLLDMATSTVAAGKLNIAALNRRRIPAGWAVDRDGEPVTDPTVDTSSRLLTPLGGTPELSSHKGYGLAAMVEILSTMLTGATYCGVRTRRSPSKSQPDIGHFFLALDPNAFRDDDGFAADLDEMIDVLHAAPRRDSNQPVLVAGEREYGTAAARRVTGIPVPEDLCAQIRNLCAMHNAPYVLEEGPNDLRRM